jgi:UPF0755 protein
MARHFAANFLNVLIIGLIALGGLIFWGKSEFTGRGPLAADAEFTVERGERLQKVADRLADAGVISNPYIFRLAARYSGMENNLKFGDYAIPAKASMEEVLALIASGRGINYQVTIPEGWTSYQIVEKLQSVEELAGEAVSVPAEGSLAPNTYAISKGDSVEIVLARMMREQQRILDEAWEERAEGLPYKTKEEALIMASIIEKETGVSSERREVASVFVNRLNKGMRLQTDPTVIYGLTGGKETLGRGLRRSELAKETPYNTYIVAGLPPTPIANPGVEAIEAALNPADTDNLYFVADGTGGHVFSRTLAEHNRNVAKWRRIEEERRKSATE